MAYSVPEPPAQFSSPRGEWSTADARAVLAWLVALIEPRTDGLLHRVGLDWDGRRGAWLDAVGSRVAERIWDDTFWEPSRGPESIVLRGHTIQQDMGPVLSGAGEALGMDLGLLLARSFSAELGDAAGWIVGAHGRTYISNRLPVLKGRGKAEFDPLLIGSNLARRYLPGHVPSPHQLGLGALHDKWLADLADPAWGTRSTS